MAQQRSAKLVINNTHSCTETAASQVIESIISRSSSQLNEKTLKALSKKMLTDEVMYKKINTVAQAYHSNPNEESLQEQSHYINTLHEGNRPFSGKIYRKQIKCQSSSKKSIPSIITKELQVFCLLQHQIKRRQKEWHLQTQQQILKPLTKIKLQRIPLKKHSSIQEDQGAGLSDIKGTVFKRFQRSTLKIPKDEQEVYTDHGSKNYYYNKNGQTVEVNPSKPRRLMKKNITRLSTKADATKRANTDSCKTQTVQYEQKVNYLKRTRQLLVLQDKPDVLFCSVNIRSLPHGTHN